MKRLILIVGLLFGLCIPASSQFNGCPAGFCSPKTVGGGFTPSCSQSSTFLAAASGVTLTADKTNYDTLICGLVTDGVWNFDVLYIWAAPDLATSKINLANPGTFNGTTHGTVSFAAYQGFTGDASTFYIDTGLNPLSATSTNCAGAPCFVQNSGTLGSYDLTNRTTGGTRWNVGNLASVAGALFAPYQLGASTGSINSTTAVGGAPASSQGAWNLTRKRSTDEALFLNSGENPATQTADTSQAPVNGNIIFFAFGIGFGNTDDQLAAGWIGAGVGNSDVGSGVSSCKVNNRINTYMATLASPKNVYSNSAC
jgi:hypothetical protein